MLQDVKTAVRQLRRESRFTTAVILMLSLAAGADLAGFTLVNAVLLQPLPYREPERLVMITESNPSRGIFGSVVSRGNYADWRRDAKSFEAIEAFDVPRDTLVQFESEAELVRVGSATDGFMQMLGVPPLAGTDEQGYRMSYAFLQRRFGGAPDAVLHKHIIVEGFREFPVPITAVMPRGFDFPTGSDLWSPLSFGSERAVRSIHVLARLRKGVSVPQAQAEMDALSDQLGRVFPAENAGWRAEVMPFQQALVTEVRPTLLVLYFSVSLLLLIATVNVGVLFLARRIQRQKDVSISVALGATHWRIVRQAIAYSLTLSAVSATVGLALAAFATRAFVRVVPMPIPRLTEVEISRAVIVATVVLAAAVAAVMVALIAGRSQVSLDSLRAAQSDRKSGGARTLRSLLLMAEVACCSGLLLPAVQSVHAFLDLQHERLGFEPGGVLAVDIRQPIRKPGEQVKHYPTRRFLQTEEAVVDYVAGLSSVSAVGIATHPPLARPIGRVTYRALEHPLTGPLTGTSAVSGSDSRQAGFEMVDAGFFQSVGIRVVEGRSFTRADRLEERQIDDFDADRGSGVAIVSEDFARQQWPDASPIGRFLSVNGASYRSVEIVGVADDVITTPGWPSVPTIYLPYAQNPTDRFTLLVRATNARALAEPITTYLRQHLGADAMAFNAQTYDAVAAGALARPRFSSRVLAVFAATAMALTAVALYSVLSFVVALRRRELAIRLALGADQRALVLSVFREGVFIACAGATAGLAGGVVLTKMLRSALSDLGSAGAPEIGIAGGLILVVASAASYWPAKRAGSVDPIELFRAE
jgi:putative ABC transport system permease protein